MVRISAVLIALFALASVARAENKPALGRRSITSSCKTIAAASIRLSELAGKNATVIAFLGTECPLAKLYGPRLAELSEKYAAQGVAFLAIDANRQDSLAEIAAYVRTLDIKFPVLKDTGNTVADAIGAAPRRKFLFSTATTPSVTRAASTIGAESVTCATRSSTIISARHWTPCWPASRSKRPTSIRWAA